MKKWQTSPSQLVIAGFLPLVEAPGGGSTGAAGAAGGRRSKWRRKMANGDSLSERMLPGRDVGGEDIFWSFFFGGVPSSKLTWQWKFTFSNRKYIFKWWIFHCHVSLPEGTPPEDERLETCPKMEVWFRLIFLYKWMIFEVPAVNLLGCTPLTTNMRMEHLPFEVFQMWIFRCHVSFRRGRFPGFPSLEIS